MAPTAAAPGRLAWQLTTVVEVVDETAQTRSIVLDAPDWGGHRAGQHVDIRLTAEDGYQAQRSYSIASAPEDEHLVITVERLDDGEVSPYLAGELRAGDQLELRGPIGGYFVWQRSLGGPLLLIAGGSGIVPFRAMLRHLEAVGGGVDVRLLYSSRSLDDVIYRAELERAGGFDGVEVRFALTRVWPDGWTGWRGRVDRPLLEEYAWPAAARPLIYTCGPSGFVEAITGTLVQTGYEAGRIRAERFGPTKT
jgi:ferredoxin-NADP reductase